MVQNSVMAGSFMSNLPLYAPKETSILEALNKIKKFHLSKIFVTDLEFKIIGTISRKEIARFLIANNLRKNDARISNIKIESLINSTKDFVVAYPNTDVEVICDIMETLNIDYMPIVKNPWDKILIGFVPFGKIKNSFMGIKIAK